MKPPMCKLCKSPHWTYEAHQLTDTPVPEYVKKMARMGVHQGPPSQLPVVSPQDVPTINRTEPLNGRNKRTRGRPRKWASEAERKKAYRSRG
ncbi:hypothetical protein LCGC14_3149240 [marine sediment metagenome]|uniref:Uncharacterized protein n=1 Tax=marine sediment metagenome TaxID=412755 RepID=A0A0F8Y1G3_9ZZZZ